MLYIVDNAIPILAATLAGLLFGLGWWRVFRGPDPAPAPTAAFVLLAVVAEFWLASILAGALILAPPEAPASVMAIATPIVIWVGFILPAFVVSLGRRRAGAGAILVEAGHWLGVMLLQALVLKGVGLVPPAS